MDAHLRRRSVVIAVALGLAAVAAVVLAGGSRAADKAFPGTNGRIVFNDRSGYLVLVNQDGSGLVRLAQTQAADYAIGASFSPDGKWIAYSKQGNGDPDIFVIRPDGSAEREITFSRGVDIDPTWSGDGQRIAFETNRNGNSDIYSVAADGSGPQQLTNSPLDELDPAWSPVGGLMAYTVESADGTSRQIWVMNADGSGKKQL